MEATMKTITPRQEADEAINLPDRDTTGPLTPKIGQVSLDFPCFVRHRAHTLALINCSHILFACSYPAFSSGLYPLMASPATHAYYILAPPLSISLILLILFYLLYFGARACVRLFSLSLSLSRFLSCRRIEFSLVPHSTLYTSLLHTYIYPL